MVANKLLAAFFFTSLGQGKHDGYEVQYASFQSNSNHSLDSFGFIPDGVNHLFQSIYWIIMQNMALHEKCMEDIAIKVGHELEKELGTLFGLMFDGWTHCEDTQTADAHVQLFENTLDVYNKTKAMVEFLVGDNSSINQSIVTKMGVRLLLSAVNDLMVDLRHKNNIAELKKRTDQHPIQRNVTRWSSTFEILERYIRMHP
ncbi:hypothetical protein JG687_00012734 [Phytophthora cactorum]|uniref:Secreted protein n=1 Tax=Phytophthora cactorum TaxID=29920 RepID=A0A8T1U273_9STRA|nr:hypothetical protein JG687_00012734 [Phytophthora cactorum]